MATQQFTIPAHDEEFITNQIQLDLDSKTATVHVAYRLAGSEVKPKLEMKLVDVVPLFQAELTPEEIQAFKKGLNLIVSTAWEKQLNDITEDVL